MKLSRIEGPAHIRQCIACGYEAMAGTDTYTAASSGEMRTPEDFYIGGEVGPYCSTCSAKMVEVDPTRSVSQFYANTAGTEVFPSILWREQ
jgi:hypothetical protein